MFHSLDKMRIENNEKRDEQEEEGVNETKNAQNYTNNRNSKWFVRRERERERCGALGFKKLFTIFKK